MKLLYFEFRFQISFSNFFIFSFNISAKIQYWNYFSFSKRSENHINFICKKFLFFSFRRWIQYFSIKNDKNFLAKFYINIRYWFYQFCRKLFDNFIHLINQSTFFSDFCDVLDIFIVFEFRSFWFCSKHRLFQLESFMLWFKN